jgi:hypothetical protein
MTALVENSVFQLFEWPHPANLNKKLFYFKLRPLTQASKDDCSALADSIKLICDSTTSISSIILDCAELSQTELIKSFWSLAFTKALDISNQGLDKFIIVSQSHLLNSLSSTIISLKHASSYTHIFPSLDQALLIL